MNIGLEQRTGRSRRAVCLGSCSGRRTRRIGRTSRGRREDHNQKQTRIALDASHRATPRWEAEFFSPLARPGASLAGKAERSKKESPDSSARLNLRRPANANAILSRLAQVFLSVDLSLCKKQHSDSLRGFQ